MPHGFDMFVFVLFTALVAKGIVLVMRKISEKIFGCRFQTGSTKKSTTNYRRSNPYSRVQGTCTATLPVNGGKHTATPTTTTS